MAFSLNLLEKHNRSEDSLINICILKAILTGKGDENGLYTGYLQYVSIPKHRASARFLLYW